MPELPRMLPAKGIAKLFGVSEQRISQLKRKGVLTPDSTNLYSVEQAMQVRGMQMQEHAVRVIAQEYSNGTGQVAPAKVSPLTQEDREALGIEVDVLDTSLVKPAPSGTFAAQTRLHELREQKLQAELDRARTRARREAGELVERVKVQSSYIAAGALIANILQNLPTELAAVFADPDTKAEVRRKVQTRVDQAHHALYAALKGYGEDDPS